MGERVRAAVRTGPERIELQEFPMPDISDDDAVLRMEVAGICGTDVKMFRAPRVKEPVIMGHENVGVIARAGRGFTDRKGVGEGDRVFLEHYVPRWTELPDSPAGWLANTTPTPEAAGPGYR